MKSDLIGREMDPGLVSVMMPVYNGERYIGQAIESLLVQSYSNWELIVVNDGSTDRTAENINGFHDARIRLFDQSNSGEAAARNLALKYIRGKYLAFLDADDVYLRNHLAVSVHYLDQYPNRDGVYTDGNYCDQNGNRLKSLQSRRRGPFQGKVFEEAIRSSDMFGPPVCVVLRTKIIARYDLKFDTDIIIGPDWDFFVQYSAVADFGYIDEKTCLYRVHPNNITARIGLEKRALELAKCRKKAIKMREFSTCSLKIRSFIFYDLLVNLLTGFPVQQTEITYWPEFTELPLEQQSRMLRLMASKAIIYDHKNPHVGDWLRRSQDLFPADNRGAMISTIYEVSPFLCGLLLRIRRIGQKDPLKIPPFADLLSA
jgi:glycosyltransferase involved in cell wall biosynthesis